MAEAPKSSGTESTRDSGRKFASQAGTEDVVGKKPLNNYAITLIHLVKGYVGTGIFALGQAFKHSGIILGACMLTLLAIINLNCQHILIRTAEKIEGEEHSEVKPTFAETVEITLSESPFKAVQRNAKGLGYATNIFLTVCEMGFCCVYFVFIATHLRDISNHCKWFTYIDYVDQKYLFLAIILVPMWASTFLGNLKLLTPLSLIANVLMCVGIGVIIYFTVQDLPPLSDRNYVAKPEKWPLFFATALFAFEGITFVIPLRNEMKHPEHYLPCWGVLTVGMILVSCLYLLVGFMGYWKYGEDVQASVFLNIGDENKDMTIPVDVIMSIAVMFTFTLHMYIPFEITFPLFYRRFGPFKNGCLIVFCYRTAMVLIIYTLANVVPFLGLFISLIGATGGSFLCLIMPGMLEIVGFYDEISRFTIAKDVAIITMGVVGAILGTSITLKEIVETFQKRDQ